MNQPFLASPGFMPAAAGAAGWVEQLLAGSLGASLAVIAVAWFGLGLLSGRLSIRRGGLLVLGCFVMFSAPSIARELMNLADNSSRGGAQIPPQQLIVPPPPASRNPPFYDPYAGASVPDARN